MKRQTPIQTQKETMPPQMRGLLPHAAVRTTPDHDMPSNGSLETRFNHDFSHIAVRPSTSIVSQDYSSASFPMFPQRYPIGGTCYTCPTRVQAKLQIGKPGDKYEQEADRVADTIMRMSSQTTSPVVGRDGQSVVQRLCIECTAEISTTDENEEDEQGIVIQTRSVHSEGARSVALDAAGINELNGGGEPLKAFTRSFFEPRFGHDFRNVLVHSDARADRLARSVNARAFTYGRHIVFRAGEYEQETSTGRHLLAHELTHTIQQGASPFVDSDLSAANASIQQSYPIQRSGVPELQRLCSDLASPPAMTCQVGIDSPGSSGTSVLFVVNSSSLTPAALTTLQSVAAAWHAGGGAGVLRIDGFASVEGTEEHNCPLSCDRANAVAAELFAPTDGSPGVPITNLEIFAQGETDQFSRSLEPNRRVVITTTGGAPAPGPACGLTVTGPNDVDHYCAAYVPSDAAACGVFPAPNITLTSAGAAAGTTPTWNIVRGGANASIVGANTGATVDIKGDAASGAQGDVTVQGTDGTCTAIHHLTVREPSEMTAADNPTSGPTFIQDIITYTVRDQFGNPMGANICVDETITVCARSHPAAFNFGDAPTDAAAGQVQDHLRADAAGGLPASLCIKLDQTLTAGGCGPLLHNTILFQAGGITLTPNDSCASGDPCP
jgi:outer membrane protein OmpA-like peptidoglycan-associated protein